MPRKIAALLLAFAVLLPAAPASAYVGPGDDRQKTAATGWWFYTGVTQSFITDFTAANGARITDLHVRSTATTPWTYDVTLVKNTGSYATAWWWYTNVTITRAMELATANKARIIKAQVYDTPAGRRATVVMVANTGTYAEAWWWYVGSISTISAKLTQNSARVVSLNAIGDGTYVAVMARNTGNDATGWWWYVNATISSISQKLSANKARVVDLDRNANGTYNVVMYSNPGTRWYWWVDSTPTTLRDKALANKQRIIDFRTYYVNGTRYAYGVMTDNAAAAPVAAAPRAGGGGGSGGGAPSPTGGVAASGTPETASPDPLGPTDDPEAPAGTAAPTATATGTPDPTPTSESTALPDLGGGDGPPVLPIAAGAAALVAAGGAVAVTRRRRATP